MAEVTGLKSASQRLWGGRGLLPASSKVTCNVTRTPWDQCDDQRNESPDFSHNGHGQVSQRGIKSVPPCHQTKWHERQSVMLARMDRERLRTPANELTLAWLSGDQTLLNYNGRTTRDF